MADKPHINLITLGHVDHGKSTLVGRLLFDSGSIPEQEMRKLKEKAKELKKETFEFAFVMDSLKEERERGVTIDLMYKGFDTNKYFFTLIDAPGHRDFVKNMIVGASQADAAILVVSAKDGIHEQTKEHAYLSKVLGISQILVAINKMDAVGYEEAKYNTAKAAAGTLLKSIGYKDEKISFVPVSGYIGDNVVKKSDKLGWWKGNTLIGTLDDFLIAPERPVNKPFRMSIQSVLNITGVGTVPTGKIDSGILKAGDKVVFEPKGVPGEVKSIEMHHKSVPQAGPGDNVGINVRGIGKNDVKKGDVMGLTSNPPAVVKEFTGQIFVLQHPTAITPGYTPVFHIHTSHVAGKITEIVKKMDPKTGAEVTTDKDVLRTGDAAIIKVVPVTPIVMEKQADFPSLAKFAIRDMGKTVAAGICVDYVKAK
jgi:elongation factor 1-alpha